jgi:hypothetical protein
MPMPILSCVKLWGDHEPQPESKYRLNLSGSTAPAQFGVNFERPVSDLNNSFKKYSFDQPRATYKRTSPSWHGNLLDIDFYNSQYERLFRYQKPAIHPDPIYYLVPVLAISTEVGRKLTETISVRFAVRAERMSPQSSSSVQRKYKLVVLNSVFVDASWQSPPPIAGEIMFAPNSFRIDQAIVIVTVDSLPEQLLPEKGISIKIVDVTDANEFTVGKLNLEFLEPIRVEAKFVEFSPQLSSDGKLSQIDCIQASPLSAEMKSSSAVRKSLLVNAQENGFQKIGFDFVVSDDCVARDDQNNSVFSTQIDMPHSYSLPIPTNKPLAANWNEQHGNAIANTKELTSEAKSMEKNFVNELMGKIAYYETSDGLKSKFSVYHAFLSPYFARGKPGTTTGDIDLSNNAFQASSDSDVASKLRKISPNLPYYSYHALVHEFLHAMLIQHEFAELKFGGSSEYYEDYAILPWALAFLKKYTSIDSKSQIDLDAFVYKKTNASQEVLLFDEIRTGNFDEVITNFIDRKFPLNPSDWQWSHPENRKSNPFRWPMRDMRVWSALNSLVGWTEGGSNNVMDYFNDFKEFNDSSGGNYYLKEPDFSFRRFQWQMARAVVLRLDEIVVG